MDTSPLGKWLIAAGLGLVSLGALLVLVGKLGWPRLPGDFSFRLGNVRVYLPLATSILLSIVLTIVFRLLGRR